VSIVERLANLLFERWRGVHVELARDRDDAGLVSE
jgi:hypothetical protein